MIGVILNGRKSPSFAASMVSYLLATGDRVTAASHKAFGKYPDNQDVIAMNFDKRNSNSSTVTGIDGYGGKGAKFADLLGNEMIFDDAAAAAHAVHKIALPAKHGGACYAHARIVRNPATGKKILEPSQAGDVRILVLDTKNEVVWESPDENLASSLVKAKILTKDQALYDSSRNTVYSAVGTEEFTVTCHPKVELEPGFRVIIGSDGIFDNLTTNEFREKIAGLDAADIIREMETVVYHRMQNYEKIRKDTGDRSAVKTYTDGYRSSPKPDNLSIAVIDISDDDQGRGAKRSTAKGSARRK